MIIYDYEEEKSSAFSPVHFSFKEGRRAVFDLHCYRDICKESTLNEQGL